MTEELKNQIITGAMEYAKAKKLSNNDVARMAKVNTGYISAMFRYQFTTTVDGKPSPIGDRWFHKLAEWAGLSIKKTYWETVPTRQFVEIISTLQEAKAGGKTAMIIGSTGLGKTKAIDTFCNKQPQYTYRITVSSLYKLADIISELADKVGVENALLHGNRPNASSLKIRVDRITNKLIEIKHTGGHPIIIFDEGENMEISTLKMIKGLYDALKEHCSIVLIGTEQLMNKLLNLRKRNRDAIPQLYRRFKAGSKTLSPLVKEIDFKPFFTQYVADKGVQKLLMQMCDNYGELNDYLEPALREAVETDQQFTEDFFRTKWNLSRLKIAL